jgi:hypothetical protein
MTEALGLSEEQRLLVMAAGAPTREAMIVIEYDPAAARTP